MPEALTNAHGPKHDRSNSSKILSWYWPDTRVICLSSAIFRNPYQQID